MLFHFHANFYLHMQVWKVWEITDTGGTVLCSFYTHGHFTHCDVIKNNNLCNLRLHSLFVDSLIGHLLSAYYSTLIKSYLEFGDGKCVGILYSVWLMFRNLYFELQNDSWVGGTTEWFIDRAPQIHKCDCRKTTKKQWWGIACGLRLMSKKTHGKITFLSAYF